MREPQEFVLQPGEAARLTSDQGKFADTYIHILALGNGKLLLTGGAELVDAIPGTDWDPNIRLAGPGDHDFFRVAESKPEFRELRDAVLKEVERFHRVQMMRPNLVVISLDYRHLGLRQICGYRIAYGHQPTEEIRCVYVPEGTA